MTIYFEHTHFCTATIYLRLQCLPARSSVRPFKQLARLLLLGTLHFCQISTCISKGISVGINEQMLQMYMNKTCSEDQGFRSGSDRILFFCLEPVFIFLWIRIPEQKKSAERALKLFIRRKLNNYDQGPSKNEEGHNFLLKIIIKQMDNFQDRGVCLPDPVNAWKRSFFQEIMTNKPTTIRRT